MDKTTQAAAHLGEHFVERVAEFLPVAQDSALRSQVLFTGWLYRVAATEPFDPILGEIDPEHLLWVGGLSAPTLLRILLDRKQPGLVVLAARDALCARYLADAEVHNSVQLQAEGMARRAIAQMALQQDQLRRAEAQSLYGGEHMVPGASPVVLTPEQLAAVDDTAGVAP